MDFGEYLQKMSEDYQKILNSGKELFLMEGNPVYVVPLTKKDRVSSVDILKGRTFFRLDYSDAEELSQFEGNNWGNANLILKSGLTIRKYAYSPENSPNRGERPLDLGDLEKLSSGKSVCICDTE